MNGIARLLIVAGLLVSGLGAAHAQNHHYKDNGDGTVSDLDTGLMWEKKTGTVDDSNDFFCPGHAECREVHNVGNRYRWTLDRFGERDTPDGPAFTDFLAVLNRDLSTDGKTITGCFANHCDWRLPNIDELATIVDKNVPAGGPTIDAIFGPTQRNTYWSATTDRQDRRLAWAIHFRDGIADPYGKSGHFFVRAVRGGF
jgi:Protein of unknown function (DUF1566)